MSKDITIGWNGSIKGIRQRTVPCLNDVTGVGAADDGLIIPLIQLFSEGSKMIFK